MKYIIWQISFNKLSDVLPALTCAILLIFVYELMFFDAKLCLNHFLCFQLVEMEISTFESIKNLFSIFQKCIEAFKNIFFSLFLLAFLVVFFFKFITSSNKLLWSSSAIFTVNLPTKNIFSNRSYSFKLLKIVYAFICFKN